MAGKAERGLSEGTRDPVVATGERTADFRSTLVTYAPIVTKVREFLERVLGRSLSEFKMPELVPMESERARDRLDKVEIDGKEGTLAVNPRLMRDNAVKLRANIAMATATYYRYKAVQLGTRSMTEEQRQKKENREFLEDIVVDHSFARLVLTAFRRGLVLEKYGDEEGFVRELLGYDIDGRELARRLHDVLAEIESGGFYFHMKELKKAGKDVEVIRTGRYVALLAYVEYGRDVDAAIRGLFVGGVDAIRDLASADANKMHSTIDSFLKTPEQGQVKSVTYVTEVAQMSIPVKLPAIITLNIALLPEGRSGSYDITNENVKAYFAMRDGAGADDVIRVTPALSGTKRQLDPIFEDLQALFMALEPPIKPDQRDIERGLEVFRRHKVDAVPVSMIDRRIYNLMHQAGLVEERGIYNPEKGAKDPFYELTGSGVIQRDDMKRGTSEGGAQTSLDDTATG